MHTEGHAFYHHLCRHVGGKQSFSLFRVSVVVDINMDEPPQNQKAVREVSLKEKKALNYSYAGLHLGTKLWVYNYLPFSTYSRNFLESSN